uniref:Heat shock protein 70 n=1 Tax=Panagrolaimus superbus TaxID=310955 RepID=A0A914YA01_9BILA
MSKIVEEPFLYMISIIGIHIPSVWMAITILSRIDEIKCECLGSDVSDLCNVYVIVNIVLTVLDVGFFAVAQCVSKSANKAVATDIFFGNAISAGLKQNSNNAVRVTPDENKQAYIIPPNISNYDVNLAAIGIDFGTTECYAAVIRKNGPDFVVLGLTSDRQMPSYVAFDEKEPKCGQIVIERMRQKLEYSVFDIKRVIGRNYDEISVDPFWPFKIITKNDNVFIEVQTFNGKEYMSPEEISAVLLSRMKAKIEEHQNSKLPDATIVITIPAKFSDQQKNSVLIAAEFSGWNNIHFLPEPVAAAFTYFVETDILNISNVLNFIVCDFGGGTVDICVGNVECGHLNVLNVDGDPYLGGQDFDNILFTHFNGILDQKFGIDVSKIGKIIF